MTIRQCISHIATQLQGSSDAPRIDADRIVVHAVGKREISYLVAHAEDELSPDQLAATASMTHERIMGKPLVYILGEADFFGRTFLVTPDVLVPRPDTEALIEQARTYIQTKYSDRKEITVADIGTGSGIIAITLALEAKDTMPSLHILATDISPDALKIARKNAELHGVSEVIEFIQGDMLSPLAGRTIDLIVSNPPYVPTDEVVHAGATMESRGLTFEPRLALDGGSDGMQFVHQIQASGIPAFIETRNGDIIAPTYF